MKGIQASGGREGISGVLYLILTISEVWEFLVDFRGKIMLSPDSRLL